MYKPTGYYHDQYGMHPVFRNLDGDVGIGTSNPDSMLHLYRGALTLEHAIGITAGMVWQNSAGSARFNLAYDNDNIRLHLRDKNDVAIVSVEHQTGNVGIGDSSPSYILDVKQGSATDPHADAWETHSSRELKEDIAEVGIVPDFSIKIYQYHIKKKDKTIDPEQKLHFGIMAEEVPEIIRGDSGKDIDLGAYITYVYALTKGLKLEISQLQSQLSERDAQMAVLGDRIAALEGKAK